MDRAARILTALSSSPEALSLPDISRRAGLEKSTAFRILCTLAADGAVTQDEMTGTYCLGFLPLRLADAVLGALPAYEVAREAMRNLRDDTQETVVLSIRDGWSRVNVAHLTSTHAVVQTQKIGIPIPLHVGAPSLVILSSLGHGEREAYFESEDFRATYGSHDTGCLRDRLKQAAEHGYLTSSGECTPGGTLLAAPVIARSGEPLGALHVAAPSGRWNATLEKKWVKLIKRCATRISAAAAEKT